VSGVEPLHIAYLVSAPGIPLGGLSGSTRHVESITRALVSLGHRVTLFAARGQGVTGGEADTGRSAVESAGTGGSAGFRGRLRIHLLSEPRGPVPGFPGRAVAEARRSWRFACRAAAWLRFDPPDLVLERYDLFSTAGRILRHRFGVPWILEVNAPLRLERAWFEGFSAPLLDRLAERATLGAADRLVVVSNPLRDYVCTSVGVPRHRVVVTGNGVDPVRFAGRRRSLSGRAVVRGNGFVVGFLGSLKPWHGADTWVDVVAKAHRARPSIHGIVVGDGPELDRMRRRVRESGLERVVRFTGFVPPDQVPDVLAAMHLLLAPYPRIEPFYFAPLKILEALAASVPVVTSAQGDLPDLVDGAGRTVPCDDPDTMARTIVEAFDHPDLLNHWRTIAPGRVVGRAWQDVAGRIVALGRACRRDFHHSRRGHGPSGRNGGPVPPLPEGYRKAPGDTGPT